MKLFVTRHGETEENVSGVTQGWLDGTLSANGIRQAQDLAMVVNDSKPTIFIVSDLGRCTETHKIVCETKQELADVKTVHDWRIRERSFGIIEGDPSAGVDWAMFWERGDDEQEFGEETNRQVRERVARFVCDLELLFHEDSVCVIISHGGIVNTLKYLEMGAQFEPRKYPNAELIEINYSKLLLGAKNWQNNGSNGDIISKDFHY